MSYRIGSHANHGDAIHTLRSMSRPISLPDESMTEEAFANLLNHATPGQCITIAETRRAIRGDDPWAVRYQSLLNDAARVYPQNVKVIADLVMITYAELKKIGKEPFPDELLKGSIDWARSRSDRSIDGKTYADFLKIFVAFRSRTDMAHESIIKQMIDAP